MCACASPTTHAGELRAHIQQLGPSPPIMDIPKHLEPMLDRTGLIDIGRVPILTALKAIGNSLPTFADARRLTDAIASRLGADAAVEHDNGPQRWVYRRDPTDDTWLLAPALVDEQGWGPSGDVPEPPRDRIVPKGPDMHAGKLVLTIGGAAMALAYDAVGMRCGFEQIGGDTFVNFNQRRERPFVIDPRARPPTPPVFPLLLRDDLDEHGHTIEQLADWIVAASEHQAPASRLRAPVALPLGSQAILLRTRTSAAVALWQGLVDRDARWLILDGLCGRAFTAGPTRAAACDGFVSELWRTKPGLPDTPTGQPLAFELPAPVAPTPTPPPNNDPIHLPTPPRTPQDGDAVEAFSFSGSFSFGGFVSVHPWPKPEPELLPAALLEIPAPPAVPEAFAAAGFAPVAIVGGDGRIAWMLRRCDAKGWTLVGEHVLDLVDPDAIAPLLDAENLRYAAHWHEMFPDGWAGQPRPIVARYALWDDMLQAPLDAPRCVGIAAGGFHPHDLDAAISPWQVLRVQL